MSTFFLWMWKQNDTQMKPEFEEIMYSIPDPVSKLTMFSHPSIGHHKTSEIGLQMCNVWFLIFLFADPLPLLKASHRK